MLTLALIAGLAVGSMYGLIALGFYVTYAVSSTVNFAQGSSVMLGAVLCFVLSQQLGWPLAVSIAMTVCACALWGALVERLAVRPFLRAGSNAWLMATVALGLVLENAVLFTFGKEPRSFPSPYQGPHLTLGGVAVYPLQLAVPLVGILVALALHTYARHSLRGKAVLAVVQNPTAASLMGIDVGATVTACYAVSGVFAGIAGMLIGPLFTVSADMGTLFGVKAFAVAILGGLTSAWGIVLAGFAYGVVEALIKTSLGSSYTNVLAFALVIVALALRPHGLLGTAAAKRV
jgi:branched-chain amino acid transport system permease protein